MPNVPDKDLPAWALDKPGDPPRGQFPVEFVFGSTDKDGKPDDEHAQRLAHNAAVVAYMMGYDVETTPREVGDQHIHGGFLVRITQPQPEMARG